MGTKYWGDTSPHPPGICTTAAADSTLSAADSAADKAECADEEIESAADISATDSKIFSY